MKRFFKTIAIFLICLLAASLPLGGLALYGWLQPHVFKNTYYAALVDKYELLARHEHDQKIVLVGGSNVAFGFDSGLIKEAFPDYEVVNFGLYGALGTKIMIDLSEPFIHEGDLIVLLPEINPQSMSLYFNGLNTLKATEDRPDIIKGLPKDDRKKVYDAAYALLKERFEHPAIIDPAGVYQRKNFNIYGDIAYLADDGVTSLRVNNVMPLRYDPATKVDFQMPLDEEFIKYVNAYADRLQKKKATLVYGFSPVLSERQVFPRGEEGLKEDILSFYWRLQEALRCEVIGNPFDCLIDPPYFYDSNFHLNDAGAILRTRQFILDVRRDVFLNAEAPAIAIPAPPAYPVIAIGDHPDSESVRYFDLFDKGNGYEIESLNEKGLACTEITLPEVYKQKPVIGIGDHAFAASSVLKTIYVPLAYYSYFSMECFDGCSSLKDVWIADPDPNHIRVDYTGALLGDEAPDDLLFHVPASSLGAYQSDYFWQAYRDHLVGY